MGTLLALLVAILALILALKSPQKKTRKILEATVAGLGLLLVFQSYYLSPLLAEKLYSLREADREISAEERVKMLAILKSAPKKKVWVTAPEGDQEARRYARQISDVFVAAGLDSDWGGMLAVTYPKGLHIFSSEPSNHETANVIKRALIESDQPCTDARAMCLMTVVLSV